MRYWLPRLHWIDLSPSDALELGLNQAARVQWQVFALEWAGFGVTIMARPRP